MTESGENLAILHGGEVEWAVSEKYGIPMKDIISFASTVSPIVPETVKALVKEFDQLHLYPPHDLNRLKEAIAAYHHLEGGARIIVGSGSTELIYLSAQVMCPGEIILPIPTYSEYETALARYGGNALFVNPDRGFGIDVDEIRRHVSSRTRAIFVCNPNNPTGRLYERDTMQRLAGIAAEKDIVLVIDEAYLCFAPSSKKHSMTLLVDSCPIIVLNSLSKLFGVPSVRLGWAVGSAEMIEKMEKFKVPWTISNLALWIGENLLKDLAYQRMITSLIEEQREELLQRLREIPWLQAFPTDCNFMLLRILDSQLTSTNVFGNLVQKGLVVRDCSSMRGLGNKYLRITIRKPEDNRKLVQALKDIEVTTLVGQASRAIKDQS